MFWYGNDSVNQHSEILGLESKYILSPSNPFVSAPSVATRKIVEAYITLARSYLYDISIKSKPNKTEIFIFLYNSKGIKKCTLSNSEAIPPLPAHHKFTETRKKETKHKATEKFSFPRKWRDNKKHRSLVMCHKIQLFFMPTPRRSASDAGCVAWKHKNVVNFCFELFSLGVLLCAKTKTAMPWEFIHV